jgi:hypothetical protein
VAVKVIFDQLVLTPLAALPICYLVKAAVFKAPLRSGLEHYVRDVKQGLLFKAWALWTPTQCLTFSVVPVHLRIAIIALVSFFWLIILSNVSSREGRAGPSAPGKTTMCYDNECLMIDEIDDPVDFPQFYFMAATPTASFVAASANAKLEAATPSADGGGDGAAST